MEGKLPDAVAAPTAWLMRKTMYAALMNRRADAVSAADGKGAFLFHPIAAGGRRPAGRAVRDEGGAVAQVSNDPGRRGRRRT